jgi:putative ABC transport system permease protein
MFFKLLFQSLSHRLLSVILNISLLALSCTLVSFFLLVQRELEHQALDSAKRVNLVLAAPGSALQVLASCIYFADSPTGNLKTETTQKFLHHPLLEKVVPISLGDSYQGYVIVGTTPEMPSWFAAQLREGKFWQKTMQAVVGANVPLKVGQRFEGSHEGQHHHEPFEVCGKLKPTGSVLDRLILTDTASYLELHHSEQSSVTAFWLRYKGSKAATVLPQRLSKIPNTILVSPLAELSGLLQRLDWLKSLFFGLSAMLLAGACLAILVSMLNVMKYEIKSYSFLRLCGASRGFVAALVLCEAAFSAAMGFVAAWVLSRLLFALSFGWILGVWPLQGWLEPVFWEGYVLVCVLFTSLLASWIPAYRAYRLPLAQTV